VTRVYVDLETLTTTAGAVRSPDVAAIRALDHLIEAGHDVVLIAEVAAIPNRLGPLADTALAAPPTELEAPAWYLTSDSERCRERTARLRTVLVGTAQASGAIHRCDRLARNVLSAVLEILAEEAMPPA
jgi:hypothetical protein